MHASASHPTLVLDAHLRHAIPIVRSLGRRGIRVVAAGSRRYFPSMYSRYAARGLQFDPERHPDALAELRAILDRHRIEVVISAGLPGNQLLCRHRAVLEPLVRAPYNDVSQLLALSSKSASESLAGSLGVPRPLTEAVAGPADAARAATRIGFPVVFKSPLDQSTVQYARNVTELRRMAAEFVRANADLVDRGTYPLVQEYVEGEGHGFYALADHGRVVAHFMHRRLHEVPPTGGPSAMATGHRDPALKDLGSRLVEATGWHGVAMVEFKKSARDGRYYFIEANPKFWGSLDLGIASGVDFPYLLYRMLTGDSMADVVAGEYRDDLVFRWLTMDLAYAFAMHRWGQYMRDFRDPRVTDDFDRDDVRPLAVLFAAGILELGRRSLRRARAPHPGVTGAGGDR